MFLVPIGSGIIFLFKIFIKIYSEECKMYEKVSSNFDFVTREKAVLDFWKANEIFEKSIEERKG